MPGYEMHHKCLNSIILAQLCQKIGQGFTMRGIRAISLHQHLYECVCELDLIVSLARATFS